MNTLLRMTYVFTLLFASSTSAKACSIFYYVDSITGNIYIGNNEDFWNDVHAYIQVNPRKKHELARIWYGWNKFAQGGINEAGLFFDGAATPEQILPNGYTNPKNRNLGDEILAKCRTVEAAIAYLETEKIALNNGHLFFGDKTGYAVIVEWVNGVQHIIPIKNNKLIATNYLLTEPTAGNFPCPRFTAIDSYLENLNPQEDSLNLNVVGQALGKAVQLPQADENGRIGGTLYSTFINLTDLQFILVYQLDNTKILHLDLTKTFAEKRKQRLKLEQLFSSKRSRK